MKKIRKDSKIGALTPEERSAFAHFMLSGKAGLEEAQAWLAQRGVCISQQAISEYYRNHILPAHWEMMNKTAALLNAVDDAQAPTAAHRAVAQRVLDLATDPAASPDLLAKFYKLMLDGQRQVVDERKLALLEAKAKAADAAQEALRQDDLTPEQREQKIREIFGMV